MKKRWWWLGSILVIFAGILSWGGGCGLSAFRTGHNVFNHDLNNKSISFRLFKICTQKMPLLGDWKRLIENKKYLILLQNNTELRPSGGFMGSYARVLIDERGVKDILVQDIYVPDGQIAGHVEPPYPIQEAFGQGWWRLRDSNWDPDFASAGATINWFFEQGKEVNNDGIVAINLDLVKKWLEIIGEIKLETYPEKVNSKNIYQLAQRYAEENFHPGSTQKRDFLGAVGIRLLDETKQAGIGKWGKLGMLIWQELQKGQITIWFKDEQLQKQGGDLGWGGSLGRSGDKEDYLYVVEANLGTNKANCCIERQVRQEINGTTEKLTINWTNKNPQNKPQPPEFWGGDYFDYVRVIVPAEYLVKEVIVGENQLKEMIPADFSGPNSLRQGISEERYDRQTRGKLQLVGFWAKVRAGEKTSAEVKYEQPSFAKATKGLFTIMVKRQPGTGGFDYQLVVDGQSKINTVIDRDRKFELWIK